MVSLIKVHPSVQRYPSRLNKANFGLGSASVTIQPGGYGRVGNYTVPKQQLVTFGSNTAKAGGIEGEPAFIQFADLSATIQNGYARLGFYDQNGRQLAIVKDERTERWAASQNDRNSAVLMTEYGLYASEDLYLALEFYPDSATAVTIMYNGTQTLVFVPITKVLV